jgi:hypothetical protein
MNGRRPYTAALFAGVSLTVLLVTAVAIAATVTGSIGTSTTFGGILQLFGATSGSVSIDTPAVSGSNTQHLPAATGTVADIDVAQTFTAAQSTSTETPTISTATFTPAGTKQNIRIVLIHASCPCTLANYSTVTAGQSGMLEIVQSSTGSDTIGTYGSKYFYVGGTSTITLSTAANATDYIPYYTESTGTNIILGGIIKGPSH